MVSKRENINGEVQNAEELVGEIFVDVDREKETGTGFLSALRHSLLVW